MNFNATGIIFSNIHDEEMQEITSNRTMGALPFGGKYRLIDFAISNMHNSGITNVGIITKNNYQSLLNHLGSGKEWDLSRKREGLSIFPPYGRPNSGFYNNKLEALYGIKNFISNAKNDYIIITDCDVICNLNWQMPLQYHINEKADITVLYYKNSLNKESTKKETIYEITADGYVTNIKMSQTMKGTLCIGTNMWIISKSLLESILEEASAHHYDNFEKDILKKKLDQYKVVAWELQGYIKKINSLNDFFDANMDILTPITREELFNKNGCIYTKVLDDVPTKFEHSAHVSNSLIADGCKIEGNVTNSILFRGVHVGKGTKISNSIIMQGSKIGKNVTLNYIVMDKNVVINDDRMLMGYELHPSYIKKGSNV